MNNDITKYENGIDFEVEPIAPEMQAQNAIQELAKDGPAMFIDDYGVQRIIPTDNNTEAVAWEEATLHISDELPEYVFRINDENLEPMVTIHLNGEVEFHPGYDPKEATETFWRALGSGMTPLMERRIELLQDLTDVQCSDGNWNHDPYMQGMANGMIFALSVMTDVEPEYMKAPEEWLADRDGGEECKLAEELSVWEDEGGRMEAQEVAPMSLEEIQRAIHDVALPYIFEINDINTRVDIQMRTAEMLGKFIAQRRIDDFVVHCSHQGADTKENELRFSVAIKFTKDTEFVHIPVVMQCPAASEEGTDAYERAMKGL